MNRETFIFSSFLVAFLVLFSMNFVLDFARSLLFDYYLDSAISFFWEGLAVISSTAILFMFVSYLLELHFPKPMENKGIYLISSAILFAVFHYLTYSTTSLSVFPYIEMNGFLFTLVSFLLIAAITSLVSLLIADLKTVLRSKSSASVTGGSALFSILGSGCPVCGSVLFSAVGIGFTLGALPFQGIELKILSLALAAYGAKKLYERQESCEDCKIDTPKQKGSSKKDELPSFALYAIIAVVPILLFTQLQLSDMYNYLDYSSSSGSSVSFSSGSANLSDVDVYSLASTSQTIVAVFPELKSVETQDDIVALMMPGGTPDYSAALGGVTFEDPVNSMEYLAKYWFVLREEVKQNNPEVWDRYIKLAAAPRGISCEFCCGVGPQGIDQNGNLRCGCKHNIALQGLTLGLMANTDATDAEILREVMKWKTMFFPKTMLTIATSLAGKDASDIPAAPSMVGGC